MLLVLTLVMWTHQLVFSWVATMKKTVSQSGDIMELNFPVTRGAGSTFTGRSGFGLKVAGTSGVAGMVRIIDFVDTPGNDINNTSERAFPICEVQLIHHQLTQVSSGV
jgi:hypothetical protein